jgi:hypothetical protein
MWRILCWSDQVLDLKLCYGYGLMFFLQHSAPSWCPKNIVFFWFVAKLCVSDNALSDIVVSKICVTMLCPTKTATKLSVTTCVCVVVRLRVCKQRLWKTGGVKQVKAQKKNGFATEKTMAPRGKLRTCNPNKKKLRRKKCDPRGPTPNYRHPAPVDISTCRSLEDALIHLHICKFGQRWFASQPAQNSA